MRALAGGLSHEPSGASPGASLDAALDARSGPPTPAELYRMYGLLSEEISDLGQALDRYLRRDLYQAHREAVQADLHRVESAVERLEGDLDEREQERGRTRAESRRLLWMAALACLGTVIANVVTSLVMG